MRITNRFCEGCGAQTLTETAKFCPRCGISLSDASADRVLQSDKGQDSLPRVSPSGSHTNAYPLSGWAKWLTAILGIYAFAALALAAMMQSLSSDIGDRGAKSRAQFEQLLSNLEGATKGYTLGAIAGAILLACWSWRVATNAHIWGSPKRSPGWTAGSWFCPVANFFVPYASLKDAWDATPQVETGSAIKEPPLLLAFIGFWGSKLFYAMQGEEPTTLSEMSNQMNLLAIAFLVEAVSAILMIKSVRAISARQDNFSGI